MIHQENADLSDASDASGPRCVRRSDVSDSMSGSVGSLSDPDASDAVRHCSDAVRHLSDAIRHLSDAIRHYSDFTGVQLTNDGFNY